MTASLETDLCGIRLRNPTVLASGILGTTTAAMKRVADNGVGAVTTKSITREPREGHANPTVVTFEAGMMNAVGISNPGVEEAVEHLADIKDIGVPVIASAAGTEVEDFCFVVERLVELPFAAVELALSCPHTPGFGTEAGQSSPERIAEIIRSVRSLTDLPLFAKLSPNEPRLGEAALAAVRAGASGITAVNTLGPGMLINIEAATPVLAYTMGGVSGPALRPIATRCVFDICKCLAVNDTKPCLIGTGGVSTGRHAIEIMMAGATAVGVGTAVYYRGVEVFRAIADEMEEWLSVNEHHSVGDVVGLVHVDGQEARDSARSKG